MNTIYATDATLIYLAESAASPAVDPAPAAPRNHQHTLPCTCRVNIRVAASSGHARGSARDSG